MKRQNAVRNYLRVLLALLLFAGQGAKAQGGTGHRLVAQDKGRVVIVRANGTKEWSAPCDFVSHDIAALPNGNLLLHTGPATVVEMKPDKSVVWQYTARPKAGYTGGVEIHAFQRLRNGLTMIAETGNLRIVEVDKTGRIVHETPLTVTHPEVHRDTRMVRKLHNGNYLVCHEGDGIVREYEPSGRVVWSYALDLNGQEATPGHDGHGTNVFGAIRLPNGNTLIAGGNNNRVLEVSPAGKIVWSVERDELPGIHLCWITTMQILPNNHLVFGNTHAGPNNPQLIEITHDAAKKVVWTFRDFTTFGNDLCASQILDARGRVLR